jgi:hypothetical protein
MDLGRALRFAFEDATWPSKAGIGAILSVVPILNFAAVGYEAEVARRVAAGEGGELPTWDDLGRLFLDGARLGLAQSLVGLPAAGLLCLPLFSAWLLLVTSNEAHPLSERTSIILLLCGAGTALFLVAWLLLSFISPAIVANYVRRGGFAACFDVRAFARLIAGDPGSYLTVVGALAALGVGGAVAIGPLTAMVNLIPCLGYFVYLLVYGGFFFYSLLVQGHLVGQLLQRATANALEAAGPS